MTGVGPAAGAGETEHDGGRNNLNITLYIHDARRAAAWRRRGVAIEPARRLEMETHKQSINKDSCIDVCTHHLHNVIFLTFSC